MRALEMSWNTEQGRLVCRWVESREFQQRGRLPIPTHYGFPTKTNRRGSLQDRVVNQFLDLSG